MQQSQCVLDKQHKDRRDLCQFSIDVPSHETNISVLTREFRLENNSHVAFLPILLVFFLFLTSISSGWVDLIIFNLNVLSGGGSGTCG